MRRLLALTLISVFALGSCGVRGKLDTPPPLWGDKDRAPIEKPRAEPVDDDDFDDEFIDLEDVP